MGGHRYRTRSVGHVMEEIRYIQAEFPGLKEIFFDDDTFTDDLPRAEAIARELGKLGVTWSCNAKANVPRETLKVLKDGGLRLLLVGYESGNQQILHNIKKGMRSTSRGASPRTATSSASPSTAPSSSACPARRTETIQETIRFAIETNPHTVQVSLAAPYPGTFLYDQAVREGWLDTANAEYVDAHGVQIAPLHYPHLSHTEIFDSVETFYRRFYFRAPEDRLDLRRDGARPADAGAAAARGRGVLPLPARAGAGVVAEGRGLKRGAAEAPRRVILTADDLGLAPAVNAAIERAHRDGVLTAASLMVGERAAAEAVAIARRNPRLAVGLHLTLTDGTPVLPPERIPALVQADGRFRDDMAGLGLALAPRPRRAAQLRAEIAAQFAAFRATGLACDHLNAHKHFHLHPVIAAIAFRAAARRRRPRRAHPLGAAGAGPAGDPAAHRCRGAPALRRAAAPPRRLARAARRRTAWSACLVRRLHRRPAGRGAAAPARRRDRDLPPPRDRGRLPRRRARLPLRRGTGRAARPARPRRLRRHRHRRLHRDARRMSALARPAPGARRPRRSRCCCWRSRTSREVAALLATAGFGLVLAALAHIPSMALNAQAWRLLLPRPRRARRSPR